MLNRHVSPDHTHAQGTRCVPVGLSASSLFPNAVTSCFQSSCRCHQACSRHSSRSTQTPHCLEPSPRANIHLEASCGSPGPHAAFPLCSPSAWIPAPRTPRMRASPIHLFPLLLFVTLSTSSREPQALWTGFQGKPGFAAPYLPGKEGPDAAPCLRFPLPGAARVAPEEPEGA